MSLPVPPLRNDHDDDALDAIALVEALLLAFTWPTNPRQASGENRSTVPS